jgi:hypothetical protein
MSLIYGTETPMHRMRVKSYPNYLPGMENTFLTRTDSEATLDIEQVCAALRDRGGYQGDYEHLVYNVKRFFGEVAYQLCDGYTVNTGYFSLYPNLGGTLETPRQKPVPEKNPLTFRIRPHKPMKDMAKTIDVLVDGEADAVAYIETFIDTDEREVNQGFMPGHMFVINGSKIKIFGDDPGNGLYLVPTNNTPPVKVTRISENTSSRVTGVLPDSDIFPNCKVEIRTQYSGTEKPLKNPRIITSRFTIERI